MLSVQNLSVEYTASRIGNVVRNVDLDCPPDQIVGLVGESGSGKTTLVRSVMGTPPQGARFAEGRIMLEDVEISALPVRTLRRQYWGRRIAYIGQDPSSILNPTRRIGRQIADSLARSPEGRRRGQAQEHVERVLESVGLGHIERITKRFPRELSGGQQQRVAIAVALINEPQVLILDEPTTALDVSTQAALVRLLLKVTRSRHTSVLWVSHDLALISQVADTIAVMYAGEIVEQGPAALLSSRPGHPYSKALIDATPSLSHDGLAASISGRAPTSFDIVGCGFHPRCSKGTEACTMGSIPLLELAPGHEVRCVHTDVPLTGPASGGTPRGPAAGTDDRPDAGSATKLSCSGLSFAYPGAKSDSLSQVGFELGTAEILGVVGESGSGKSTLLKVLAGLVTARSGTIQLTGAELKPSISNRTPGQKRAMQLIFQHADLALNPRLTVREIIGRPLTLAGVKGRKNLEDRIAGLLDQVRMPAEMASRLPGELSGGQRQRVGIARALALDPQVLLCDEITSATDVSAQAAILELVKELVVERKLSVVFVTHNLAVVKTVSDRTMVMLNGAVVESGPSEQLWLEPRHEYTKRLIADTPVLR